MTKEELRDLVWLKGHLIPGRDPAEWRRDDFQMPLRFSEWGNRDSSFGWEIDHITPKKHGGGDEIDNLRPLQWEINVARNQEDNQEPPKKR